MISYLPRTPHTQNRISVLEMFEALTESACSWKATRRSGRNTGQDWQQVMNWIPKPMSVYCIQKQNLGRARRAGDLLVLSSWAQERAMVDLLQLRPSILPRQVLGWQPFPDLWFYYLLAVSYLFHLRFISASVHSPSQLLRNNVGESIYRTVQSLNDLFLIFIVIPNRTKQRQ